MVYGEVKDFKEVERAYREVSYVKIYFDFCSYDNFGDRMRGIVEKLDHKGRGIVREEKIPVFIFDALPKEEISYEYLFEKKKYKEAKVIEVFEKSNDRISPVCPYFGLCGGCDLMHMTESLQKNFKEEKVKEILQKFCKEEIKVNSIVKINSYFYRNKAMFKVKKDLGYYKRKSNDLIPISSCFLVSKKINEIVNVLKTMDLSGIDEVMVRSSSLEDSMVVFYGEKRNLDLSKLKGIASTVLFQEEILYGKGFIEEKIGDFLFKISPESFFQINSECMYLLYKQIVSYGNFKKSDVVLDYYCGTGTIGLFVSPYVKEVIGVEINEQAVKDAYENKKKNQVDNISFFCMNANKFTKTGFDVVIVDPPRNGLDEKTRNHLLKINPSKIIYVSCDPVTLARDLNILKEFYEIKEVTPFDMFPNTYHVECVCLLKLR